MRHCYVQTGVVVEGPRTLPITWTDPITKKQYSNLRKLSSSEQLALGWHPYVENDPGSPGQYFDRSFSDFTVNPTNVTRDVIYTQWDIERLRRQKNDELESQIPEYTTNQAGINPKVKDYIIDDAQWLAENQTQLASLSDWNAVAAFDTDKPSFLVLSNSYVGRKNVEQGVVLTSQNLADAESGRTPRWPQAKLNSYIAGNQAAADDSTNATPPVKGDFELRQGLAEVSEQFSRIVIWRFDVEGETDPNLDRSMAMRIIDRKDSRDIFTFIYTGAGSTYLGFKKFVDIGDGIWEWRLDKDDDDGAIMPWTDSDIAVILSYIDNPAVQEEWFTRQIQFPAGTESDNILVAWDTDPAFAPQGIIGRNGRGRGMGRGNGRA